MKVLFWINKCRVNQKGEAPLMLRVTHQGKRTNVSTEIRVVPDQWDNLRQRVKGNSDLSKEINQLLQTQKTNCISAVESFLKQNLPFCSEDIAKIIKGESKSTIGFLELFDVHIGHLSSRIGVDYTKPTIVKYKSSKRNLKKFFDQKLNKKDLDISLFTRKHAADLDQFLRGELKFKNNHVIKTIEQIRKVYKQGILYGYANSDPFDALTFRKSETHKDFLTKDELSTLLSFLPPDKRMQETKDAFIFMCFTGLAHSDAIKANINHVKLGSDNRPWLMLQRTKNNNPVKVPLLPLVLEIIEKYNDHWRRIKHGQLVPVTSNQVFNRALKLLAERAGIKKHLCSHSGRYTYASTVLLSNGIRVEVAQKLLAHNSIKSTMVYAKLSEHAIAQEIERLENNPF